MRLTLAVALGRPPSAVPPPVPSRTPVEAASGVAPQPFLDFLGAVLTGELMPSRVDADPSRASGSRIGALGWWDHQLPCPLEEVGKPWTLLETRGQRAEVATWLAVTANPAVTELIGRHLVHFQATRTVVAPGDHLPAIWTPVGVQAAIAVYEARVMARETRNGASSSALARERLANALATFQSTPSTWGDALIVLPLQTVAHQWQGAAGRYLRDCGDDLEKTEDNLRRLTSSTWLRRMWRQAKVAKARTAQTAAAARVEAAKQEIALLDALVAGLAAINPLGVLVDPKRASNAPPLELSAMPLGAPGCDGVRDWLARHVARGVISSGPDARVWTALAAALGTPDREDKPAIWNARRFVARVFRGWSRSRAIAHDAVPGANGWPPFFEAWRNLVESRELLRGQHLLGSMLAGQFFSETWWMDKEVGTAVESARIDLVVADLFPIAAAAYRTWDDKQRPYLRETFEGIGLNEMVVDMPWAWQRRIEVSGYFRAWAARTADVAAVGAAIANQQGDRGAGFETTFAIWRALNMATHAAATQHGEFRRRYLNEHAQTTHDAGQKIQALEALLLNVTGAQATEGIVADAE